jgi:hypothetical protein
VVWKYSPEFSIILELEWGFIGDTFYDDKTDRGKPVAENSYGHQTTMFFRNNKLIGYSQ